MTTTYAERLARLGPPPSSYDPAVAAKMSWAEAIPYIAENADANTLKATIEARSREWEGHRIAFGRGVDPKTNPGIKKMLDEARKATDTGAAQYPDLTMNGFHYEADDRFEESRRDLLEGPYTTSQVATSLAFISQLKLIKAAKEGSYGLKHEAEYWGRCYGMSPYVANGAFIVAALYSGATMRRVKGSPNCLLGISWPSRTRVRDLCDVIERKLNTRFDNKK